ncbi:HAMP domain-containing sensor histidine kinase [Vitiosangium sp. GDMCC 1.1324]|uniref:sensor histidine kinase n=1 Tax=Vitiosangium sp. (strain GDMCC 1.1324) TaxID=2138576 RepID=UPI0021010023|nr:ATP-binding protein [Vitiosangium sp. GDMCC 1.1324]
MPNGATPRLHRPGAQPSWHPSAALLDPSAPALSLNTAPIPPICETEGEGIWDSERLAQVVSNLVGNALEHGDHKGSVYVRCVAEPERQVLEITNPGSPIPSHQLATLFDPFRQRKGRSGRGSGLGLGLFIVRELVEAHGGHVAVRSTEEGTTFSVYLPRDSRPEARSGGQEPETVHPS